MIRSMRSSAWNFRTIAFALSVLTIFFSLFHFRDEARERWTAYSTRNPASTSKTEIPRKIWQIFLTPPKSDVSTFEIDAQKLSDSSSWLAKNPDYDYRLVGDEGAKSFIESNFQGDLLDVFKSLPNTGSKSDLLRYLILYKEGGVYTDTDTVAVRPIKTWVPEAYHNASVVVGIEYDRLDGGDWGGVHKDLQFCQWTIAAAPGHPLFSRMVNVSVTYIHELALKQNTTLANITMTEDEVMESTGPMAWTDAVWEELQQYDVELTHLTNLSGIWEPRLIGDILIMPIDAFGMGQLHSNSTPADSPVPDATLARHMFHGSWRDQK